MSKIKQIRSQAQQLFLFHTMFPWYRLWKHIICSPFDYYCFSGKARFPLAVNFLITSACNLKCSMCNYQALLHTRRNDELSTAEIKDFFKREHKKKFHVFLSGGEPFMREDIFDIIETIKHFGLTCGIITNGTLLNERKIRHLLELHIDYLIFSLLGPRKVHDAITGIPGSFDTMVHNMKLIASLRKNTKLFINVPITNLNMPYLLDIVGIAEESGADVLRFEQMNFITEEEDKRQQTLCNQKFPHDDVTFCTYKVSKDIVKQCEENRHRITQAMHMRERGRFKIPVYFKPFLHTNEIYSWYSQAHSIDRKCFFIWKSLFINPYGDILPCQFLIYKLGNIKQDKLDDVWNNQKYRNLRKQLKKELLPGCLRCCKL